MVLLGNAWLKAKGVKPKTVASNKALTCERIDKKSGVKDVPLVVLKPI